jgi:hypothetical protein
MAQIVRRGVPFAGAEAVMKLPGPVTQYTIIADGDGNAMVLRHSNVTGVQDPGTVPFRLRDNTVRRELAGARLKQMNSANREFWARQVHR